jgi:hypothetical protein
MSTFNPYSFTPYNMIIHTNKEIEFEILDAIKIGEELSYKIAKAVLESLGNAREDTIEELSRFYKNTSSKEPEKFLKIINNMIERGVISKDLIVLGII